MTGPGILFSYLPLPHIQSLVLVPITPSPCSNGADSTGHSQPSPAIWHIPACPKYMPGLGGDTLVTAWGKKEVRGGTTVLELPTCWWP